MFRSEVLFGIPELAENQEALRCCCPCQWRAVRGAPASPAYGRSVCACLPLCVRVSVRVSVRAAGDIQIADCRSRTHNPVFSHRFAIGRKGGGGPFHPPTFCGVQDSWVTLLLLLSQHADTDLYEAQRSRGISCPDELLWRANIWTDWDFACAQVCVESSINITLIIVW